MFRLFPHPEVAACFASNPLSPQHRGCGAVTSWLKEPHQDELDVDQMNKTGASSKD
jgi:hypothetical protein